MTDVAGGDSRESNINAIIADGTVSSSTRLSYGNKADEYFDWAEYYGEDPFPITGATYL